MGGCGWLHDQATLPHNWCGYFMQTWCPDWVWEIGDPDHKLVLR